MKVIGYIVFQFSCHDQTLVFEWKIYANHLNIQLLSSMMIFYKRLPPVKNLNAYSLGDLASCFRRF